MLGKGETRIDYKNITIAMLVSARFHSSHSFLHMFLTNKARGMVLKGFFHMTYGWKVEPRKE